MTREEALKTWLPIIKQGVSNMSLCAEALDMAIKALEQEPCEDCISREATMKLLNDGWWKGVYPREAIAALPSVTPMQKWIPVSERLPVHNDVYLVALNMVGYPVRDIDGFVVQEQMWERYGKKVLAWMPLPEPYKESEG